MGSRKVAIIFLVLAFIPLHLSAQEYRFTHIDASHGLSHNSVTCMLKDRTGFLWIGTQSGLNRFDGYSFKVFRNDPSDSTSLINEGIENLFETPDGKLGIISGGGICFYDPAQERFSTDLSFLTNAYGINAGAASSLTNIIRDHHGNYWFLLQGEGVVYYDVSRKQALSLFHDAGDTTTISSNTVTSLVSHPDGSYWIFHSDGTLEKLRLSNTGYEVVHRNHFLSKESRENQSFLSGRLLVDQDGDLWFYIRNDNLGVFFFDLKHNRIRHIDKNSPSAKLNNDMVTGIVEDNKGLLWISTDHGGINIIDKRTFSVRYLTHNPENKSSIGQNSIPSLYKDDEGIIWLGTYKKGFSYYHENIKRFPLYNRYSEPYSLPYEDVNRFLEDEHGNLWIGTNGGGLLYFNRKDGKFTRFRNDPDDPNSLSADVIVSLCMDHEKKLWIGTYFGGLNCYDGKAFIRYRHDPSRPKSLLGHSVWEILEDSQNRLWIGTLDAGLQVFNREARTFERFAAVPSAYISVLTEDRAGNIWIGTSEGVYVLTRATGEIVHYETEKSNPLALPNNYVQDIREDSKGRIWVGTQRGLSLFEKKSETFKTFTERDGLPHNSVLTILEDIKGSLWVGTPNGLAHMTISERASPAFAVLNNYTEADGLQGMQFNENAAFRTSRDELIFGGANGFNMFRPDELGINLNKPKVIFSDFQLFNKSVGVGDTIRGKQLLEKAITQAPSVVLPADKNVFSIGFAALNFFQPDKNLYKYKLEGFNKNWLLTDSKSRRVTFTNLNAGDYVFRVIASNNDGIWNRDGASLHIKVLPPFWKSSTAYVMYTLIIILGLFLTRKIIQQREQMKFAIQQERQEALRMHELDMMKIRFFTNVSHEFRTPLTLILTPIERLIRATNDPDQIKHFDLIRRNARRLLNLVNQLLDFRKMEVQEIKFQPSEGDIIKFTREAVFSFSDLSEKNDIGLAFHSSISSLEMIFDQDKLEKILFNLLSNAFKFTPAKGLVSVDVDLLSEANEKWIRISVKDTGIGISQEKLGRIFDRFFQNELPKSMVNQGSGIGLSIAREFVKIHGGTISVQSEIGTGTCFDVRLPAREIIAHVSEPALETTLSPVENEERISHTVPDKKEKPLILLVEDNEDFRFYLKDNLKMSFSIIEARTGEEGWKKTVGHFPDLLVADIMMPGMNGLELCKSIKADKRICHIPVILLTARTTDEQRLEGIESGADDYISKPFNFEILESRIRNLILQREKVHKALSGRAEVRASELQITSLDEHFIRNAILYVEKNVSNPEFTVQDLSHELGVSRAHFFKKILALTGKSPLEFIRAIRMQQAAQLLEKSQLTVAEIAYKVGFNNPKYFARYFKDVYHVLPSAYAAGKRRS